MPKTPPQRSGISVTEKDIATLNNYAEKKLQETHELSEVMDTVPSVIQRGGIYLISAVLGFTTVLLYFGKVPVWVNARGSIVPEVENIEILAAEDALVTEVVAEVGQQLPKDAVLFKTESTSSNFNSQANLEELQALPTLQAKELDVVEEKVQLTQLELQLNLLGDRNNQQAEQLSQHYREQIKSLEAEIANIRTQINLRSPSAKEAEITMPQAGVVEQLTVKSNQLISQGTVAAVVAPSKNSLIVKAHISEQDISSIEPGMEAQVKIDAYNSYHFGSITAQISKVMPDLNNLGNFIAILNLSDQEHRSKEIKLLPGLNVQVEIQTDKKTSISNFVE